MTILVQFHVSENCFYSSTVDSPLHSLNWKTTSLLWCVHTDRLGFRSDNVSELKEKMGTVNH